MNATQKFYSLTRGAVYSFLCDGLGYSVYELNELSTDELFDLVPESEYANAYRFAKG